MGPWVLHVVARSLQAAALAGGLLEALLAKGLGVGHAGVRVHGMLRSSFVTLVADQGLREGCAMGTCERKAWSRHMQCGVRLTWTDCGFPRFQMFIAWWG